MPFKKGKENVFYKHGLSQTRFYRIYKAMMYRCYNENTSYYHIYGGKGIKVCKRWHNFRNFEIDMLDNYRNHLKVYGRKNTSLDRINSNKNYMWSNCRWATLRIQSNNSSNCHYLKFNGKEMSMMEWSRETGISYNTLRARINKHKWSIEDALTTKPIKGRNQFG